MTAQQQLLSVAQAVRRGADAAEVAALVKLRRRAPALAAYLEGTDA